MIGLLMLSWLFTAIILLIAVYFLTGSLFFTFMRENTMKAIVTNGRLRRFISNVQGKMIDQADNTLKTMVNADGTSSIKEPEPFLRLFGLEWERWLYDHLGLRWVGIPIFNQVLTIPINRVVWKKDKAESKTTLGRIKVTTKKTDELYHAFPRPIEMSEVDTKDGFRLDLSLLAFIEVCAPYFAFFTLKDSFMITLDSVIKGYVTDVLKGLSWEEFKEKKESANTEALFDFTTLSSRMMVRAGSAVVDLIVDDFSISASSKKLQEAVEEQKIAEERGKATETEAEYKRKATEKAASGEKRKRTLEGEGDAAAIEAIAKATAKRYSELIDVYKRNGFTDKEATEKAQEKIALEFKWVNVGKMTGTYVEGGATPVQPTIPLGGRRP